MGAPMTIISLPVLDRGKCRYEAAPLEEGDENDPSVIRQCRLFQKCTREFVSNVIRVCSRCQSYISADGKYPPGAVQPVSPPPLTERPNTRVIIDERRNPPINPRYAGRAAVAAQKERVLAKRGDVSSLTWAYGITTVPDRWESTFLPTLESIKTSGFDNPLLFVDKEPDANLWRARTGLEVVSRWPRLGAYGNWILALGELYIRSPKANRYAIFQDDLTCVRNLRAYLEKIEFPSKGYLNLYTFPENQALAAGRTGFYKSNKQGKGALCLVFNNEGVRLLLATNHMVNRLVGADAHERGHKFIDGAVVETMNHQQWSEYVHNPSLVQHTGFKSTLNNPRHPTAPSYPGDAFDALSLLNKIPDADVPSVENSNV